MFGRSNEPLPQHTVWEDRSPRESHQAQVLLDFQRWSTHKAAAERQLSRTQNVLNEAEAGFEEARKTLRRVAEGAI